MSKLPVAEPLTEEEFLQLAGPNYQEPQALPQAQPLTMDDMLADRQTFDQFYKGGYFDSQQGALETIISGGAAMVEDVAKWAFTLPERVMANFEDESYTGRSKRFKQDPEAQKKAREKAAKKKADNVATTLQVLGETKLNWEALWDGGERLVGKVSEEALTEGDLQSAYEFWSSMNNINKRRDKVAADIATGEFVWLPELGEKMGLYTAEENKEMSRSMSEGITYGMTDEMRQKLASGEAQPDRQVAAGGSIVADPLNYIPLGAGFKLLKGGKRTKFKKSELAILEDLQKEILEREVLRYTSTGQGAFGRGLGEQAKARISVLNDQIAKNMAKVEKFAPNRDIALRVAADKMSSTNPVRKAIEEALAGAPIEGKSSLLGKIVGGTGVVTGKSIENVGNFFNFLGSLPRETAIYLGMKFGGMSEKRAIEIFDRGLVTNMVPYAASGGAAYALTDYLTDDEILSMSAAAAITGPMLLRRYGRDMSIMGRELMNPETTLPYWKRLGINDAEMLADRLIDRSSFGGMVKDNLYKSFGAADGQLGKRAKSVDGQLLSPASKAMVDVLNRTKTGRWVEQAGRITNAGVTGAAYGGVFSYIASGGIEDEDTFYGGIGGGFALGSAGGALGGVGKMRGFRTAEEAMQQRYGDFQWFKENLLPEGQREAYEMLPKEAQLAYASAQMSFPDVHFHFVNKKDGAEAGKQGIADDRGYIEVDVNSGYVLEPLIRHEITHYLDQVGGSVPFNDMLIGNKLLDRTGIYTKLEDGKPIVGEDGLYVMTDEFEARRREYAHRWERNRNLSKEDLRKVMPDEKVVREIVAEHGVDFFLNDARRYRDLHEGPIGALLRNVYESKMLSNQTFLRNIIGKLGGNFRGDGALLSPNGLFKNMARDPKITELIRKYNREIEGLSPENRKKNFPLPEGEQVVDLKGADFAKNPELIELLKSGTFMRIDENGNVISDLAMSPKEQREYNKKFANTLSEEIQRQEDAGNLPEGHVRARENEKTGEINFEGRFVSEETINAFEQRGVWNKNQIDTLRQINQSIRDGGGEFLISYFKATTRGGGKYVNAKVQNQMHIPYGIQITQKGNINIRTISMDQLVKNVDKMFRQQGEKVSKLYDADINVARFKIMRDIDKYHQNHAQGLEGFTGLDPDVNIARQKADFINAMFGPSSKDHIGKNPWLDDLQGKKSPTPTYRTLRIERIGKVDQFSGKKYVDHRKLAENFMPASVLYVKGEKTGPNPKQQPNPFDSTFNIKEFSKAGYWFDVNTKKDISDNTYENISVSTLQGRPQLSTSDKFAKLPEGKNAGGKVQINMVDGRDQKGSRRFKWIDNWSGVDTPWMISIKSEQIKGKHPKDYPSKPTNHAFALSYKSEVPSKLARYPKEKSNPRGKPTSLGDVHLGNPVGVIEMKKGRPHFVYDQIIITEKGAPRPKSLDKPESQTENFMPAWADQDIEVRSGKGVEKMSMREAMIRNDVSSINYENRWFPKSSLKLDEVLKKNALEKVQEAFNDNSVFGRVAGAWTAIAENPNSFRTGKSVSTDLKTIVNELSGGKIEAVGGLHGTYKIRSPYGKDDAIIVHTNKLDSGETRVEVNSVYAGDRGKGFGSTAYQAILDYAAAIGAKYEGHALSDINSLRVTSAQLSSALKHGRTDYFDPAPEQGIDVNAVREWGKDFKKDVSKLAVTEMNKVLGEHHIQNIYGKWDYARFEALDDIHFDFENGQFYEIRGGKRAEVTDKMISDYIEAVDPRFEAGVGAASAKRAIITREAFGPSRERKITESTFEAGRLDDILYMPKKEDGQQFARPLEEILRRIPPEQRFVGSKQNGKPVKTLTGKSFLELDLDEKIGDLGVKQADIDKNFAEAVKESGPAAEEAVKRLAEKGDIMRPPPEEHWAAIKDLPLRDRFWYEVSSEAMGISFPDHHGYGLSQVMDMTAATSPLADPNYNAQLMISIMSEQARNVPSTTPAVVQKSVADVFSGEFGKQEARKVGSFGQTFKFINGILDDPPLPTNDRQVAASFDIPDKAFGDYPVLYEVVARWFNKTRDDVNKHRGYDPNGVFESYQLQAPSWVQTRAEQRLKRQKDITDEVAFEGDAYANAFKRAAEKLRDAGMKIEKDPNTGLPLFTLDVLKDPRVTETLSPLAMQFKNDQFGTMEINTLLNETGSKLSDALNQSVELGLGTNVRKIDSLLRSHMKKLTHRRVEKKKDANGKVIKTIKHPSLISQLHQMMGSKAAGDEITRLEIGKGTFEGKMSWNIRIPMDKINPKDREAFLAYLGTEYMQAAQAASRFSEPKGDPFTYSVFVKGAKLDNPNLQGFAETLSSKGHEANISQRPNGLVLDINPAFGDDGSMVGIKGKLLEELTEESFGNYDFTLTGKDYESIYIEKDQYNSIIRNFKNRKKNEFVKEIGKITGLKGKVREDILRGGIEGLQEHKDSVRSRVEKVRTRWRDHTRASESITTLLGQAAKEFHGEIKDALPDLTSRIDKELARREKQAARKAKADQKRIKKDGLNAFPAMPQSNRLPPRQNTYFEGVPAMVPRPITPPRASKASSARESEENFYLKN